VAAFSRARSGRLLLVQGIVLLLYAGAVFWFLNTVWFPIIRDAIGQLPETGQMENQQLVSTRISTEPLVPSRFVAFLINAHETGASQRVADLQVEFRTRRVVVCSFLGCRSVYYVAGWRMPLNRPELESWWQAWEPVIYIIGVGAATLLVFVSWLLLATLYCPFVRLYAFLKDRDVTLLGSWKLASAALLPGSLLVSTALVLYGLGTIGVIRFFCLWVLHFVLGWVFAAVSTTRLPSTADALPEASQNPFGDGEEKEKARPDPNPFVAAKS
jgi:hypothetical protein